MATASQAIQRDLSYTDMPPSNGHGEAVPAAAMQTGRSPATIELSRPQSIVHCLLFVIEYASSADPRWQEHKRNLSLFFSRAGGVHLLLMLLNAYYHKPIAGRRPGWVFRGIRDRIQISERGLRMLINDAMAEGLIVQLPGQTDKRCHSYGLAPPVIEAWEALTDALCDSLGDVLGEFDAGALANVDYRKWDPAAPARDQIEYLPPSRRPPRRRRG